MCSAPLASKGIGLSCRKLGKDFVLIFDVKLYTFPSWPPQFTFLRRTFRDSYSPMSSLGMGALRQAGLENGFGKPTRNPSSNGKIGFFLRHP